MKALIKASMLDESVGMAGTYWNDGSKKADAEFVVCFCDRPNSSLSFLEPVGVNEEFVSMTL